MRGNGGENIGLRSDGEKSEGMQDHVGREGMMKGDGVGSMSLREGRMAEVGKAQRRE